MNAYNRAALSRLDTTDLRYLKQNDPNAYQDALRSFVDQIDVLSPRQKILQSEETFEDAVTGDRKSVQQILESMAGRKVEILNDAGVVDLGARNAAPLSKQAKGQYKGNIGVNPDATHAGQVPMRAKDVQKWINDPVAIAYVDPGSVSATETNPVLNRAALYGSLASAGDRVGLAKAQQRYSFSDDEVKEFISKAMIGKDGFASSIRKSGLPDDRALAVIDPETGVKVVDLGKAGEKAFYDKRVEQLGGDWLRSGGTAFLDPRSDIAIPGNHYQMEHDTAFSLTNDKGLAETPANRPGFYERYVNSEKGELDPTTYYQTQRLHALAAKKGINLTGVMKDGIGGATTMNSIMEKHNPSVTQTGERLIADRTDIHHPERAKLNAELVAQAVAPQRMAADMVLLQL